MVRQAHHERDRLTKGEGRLTISGTGHREQTGSAWAGKFSPLALSLSKGAFLQGRGPP